MAAGVSWMDSSASKWTPTLKGVAKEQMVTWVVARPHSWPEIREGPGDYHIEDLVVLQFSTLGFIKNETLVFVNFSA